MNKVFRMRISKEGSNVNTAEVKDLVMDADYNMLKTKKTGLVTGTGTVAHELSYIPLFFTSRQSGGNGSCIGDDPTTTADSTNLNIGANTVKYYIFFRQ